MTVINDLNDLINVLDQFWKTVNRHHHIRLWYRGQANEQWGLTPGVYRPGFNATSETERLEKEQQLNQDFKVQSASLLSGNPNEVELYFLQQHYKMPTRLLDWSQSPLTALYFALSGNIDADAALYMMDAYQLAHSQQAFNENDGFKGTPTSSFPLFINAVRTISHWKTVSDFPKYILPVRPLYTDKRIQLQKACFTFHVPRADTLTSSHNSTLQKIIIPKDKKSTLLRQLSLLGVNDFTTFGDMESLSSTLILNHL